MRLVQSFFAIPLAIRSGPSFISVFLKITKKKQGTDHISLSNAHETSGDLFSPLSYCQTFVVKPRNPVSSSVISIYLRSELTYIDTKILSAGCPLGDVLGSACGMPPPCHLDV